MYENLVKSLKGCVCIPCEKEKNANCLARNEEDCRRELMAQAADAIEELSKDLERSKDYEAFWEEEAEEALRRFQLAVGNKPRWISVEERLPECAYGAEVGNVVFRIGDRVYAGCYGVGGRMRDRYFRVWTDASEGWDAKDVDAWYIPTLPAPPKEG